MVVVLVLYYCILNISIHFVGKAFVPKKMVDPIMENVTLEPELEEALSSASDAELCDIAGTVTHISHSHALYAQDLLLSDCSSFHPQHAYYFV